MRVVDLSMPIAPHFRWRTQVSVMGDIAAGDQFRVSRLDATCHGFTHVDAQAHILADAPTIESTPLDRVVGACRVLRLDDVSPEEEIGPGRLAAADPGNAQGEILLLASGWDGRRDSATPEFWRHAPWLNRAAAEWLATRRPTAVAFDFPQDYPIRLLLDRIEVPFEQHVTHDVLLRSGVTLIEYLVNARSLREPRCLLSAAPLKIPGADGAPARVHAVEGLGV
jgi:arylformamidase